MASYLAIAAVAKAVLKLIDDHCPREEFAATPRFVLTSGHEVGQPPVTEGFTLFIWRVGVNSAMRNQAPRRLPDGRLRRPPLPVDLGLLLTPWSTDPEAQLRLMGWALRFLDDHTIVPASMLNQSLSRRTSQAFNPDEAVELLFDAPALPDYLGLWDKFRNRWQTPLTYSARMVAIESERTQDEGTPVQARAIAYGQPSEGSGQ